MMDLKEIGDEIKTQDNLSTADPIFILFEWERIPTSSDYSDEYFFLDRYDCDEVADTIEELIEYCKDSNKVKFPDDFDSLSDVDKEEFITEKTDIERVYYIEKKMFSQAFFTKKSAEKYLESNRHHYKKPFIYCASMWRNDEMQTVRNALMNGKFDRW